MHSHLIIIIIIIIEIEYLRWLLWSELADPYVSMLD